MKIKNLVLTLLVLLITSSCGKKEGDVIKIGAILPLTGDASAYGKSAKQALDLALKEINQTGGIGGIKVEIIYEDDKGNPTNGVSAINKLISVNHVKFIIGAMPSSVTLAIAPIAEKNRIILLSPVSSAPSISYSGDYIFRNCISDSAEGGYMAYFSKNILRINKVGILYINNDYGNGLKSVFTKVFIELGGVISVAEAFSEGSTDFKTQLIKIKESDAEAIYLLGYREMINVFKQIKELGIKLQILSSIMLYDKELVMETKGASEGALFTAWPYDPNSKDESSVKFIKNYEKEYNSTPDVFAAQSYDAIYILKLAIENCGSDTDKIKNFLVTLKNYPGVSGNTSFNTNGDAEKPLRILRIVESRFEEYK